jgi:Flp pilus assembly protein TadG
MRRLTRALRDRNGLAATEFALFLPILLMLFFGMLEGADLLTVNRRLAHTANTIADLTARERTINHAQFNDMLTGARRLLEPTDTSTLSIRVVSVISSGTPARPTVHWSRDQNGATPYAAGAPYTGLTNAASLNNGSSLIVVEVTYNHVNGLTSQVFSRPYHFFRTAKRWPRKSTRVQLCNNGSPPTCTT